MEAPHLNLGLDVDMTEGMAGIDVAQDVPVPVSPRLLTRIPRMPPKQASNPVPSPSRS